ncbi:MarR family winged helix-turn-helix transcriptional regulator [Marinobacter zhanjiangensis]|uniref:MarR family transcriptional regulator n=1 Tax=Marinobacter zhanjiangensis TaxID=578215 RepID=A0ABQ3BD75_9GAMM|nr:MarR family transcriptional regulator [Marinobacter zhanjiangensis]GGY84821.1 MarR family transcriptional regulator [Marinobacter zhanjiangensis]
MKERKALDSEEDINNLLALDNQLCFALYAVNRAITGRYRPLLAELDLTYPQYLVMLVMWEADRKGDSPRVSSIGERLRLDSGTLTPLLRRLEQRGLLTRQRSSEDERVVTVALTDEGRAMREKASDVPLRLLCDLGVGPEQAVQLREDLRDLLSRVEGDR